MGALKRLLVPLDGSAPSLAALEHALVLADECGATIDLLHVEAPDDFEVGSSTPMSPAARAEARQAIDAATTLAKERLGAEAIRVRTIPGEPLRTIIEVGADGYDLIVMGTHGHVGRLHAIVGSIAAAVARHAPCPVLTVREPGLAYQSFADRRHGRPTIAEHARRRRASLGVAKTPH